MAIITSNWTGWGLASLTTSWIWWVVPTIADDVVISATDTIELDWLLSYHSVNTHWTLRASRTMSSSLTIFTSSTATRTVDITWRLDFWTSLDRIPNIYTAKFILDSAINWVVYYFADWATIDTYWELDRTRWTQVTTQVLTWWTVVNVKNATNWQVWDMLTFESATLSLAVWFTSTIASIVWNTVTLTTPTTYNLEIDYTVHNETSNVKITSNDPTETMNTHCPVMYFYMSTSASDSKINIHNTELRWLGTINWNRWGLMFMWSYAFTTMKDNTLWPQLTWCSFVNFSWNVTYNARVATTFSNVCAITNKASAFYLWAQVYLANWSWHKTIWSDVYISWIYGWIMWEWTYTNLYISNTRYAFQPLQESTVDWGRFSQNFYSIFLNWSQSLYIKNLVSNNAWTLVLTAAFWDAYFIDCIFNVDPVTWINTQAYIKSAVYIVNKNNNTLLQFKYWWDGNYVRDNTIFKNGSSSLQLNPKGNAIPMINSWDIVSINNEHTQVSWYLRIDPAYNWALPQVKMSWLGIIPVVWTAPAWYTTDTWIQWGFTTIQNTWFDWTLTLELIVSWTAWAVWIDWISAPAPVAVDTGAMWTWALWKVASLVAANFSSPNDVWNKLTSDITLPWSIWELLAEWFTFNNVWPDEHIWWTQTISLNAVPW